MGGAVSAGRQDVGRRVHPQTQTNAAPDNPQSAVEPVRPLSRVANGAEAPAHDLSDGSLRSLFERIDQTKSGLLDKAKVLEFQRHGQSNSPDANLVLKLLERVETGERITYTEVETYVREQQRSELQRFFLSQDIHKILAEATVESLGVSVDALDVVCKASKTQQLSHLISSVTEKIVGQIEDSLEIWHDEQGRAKVEGCLRKTAQLALGVHHHTENELVDKELKNLQQEYSNQLKSRQGELTQTSEQTSIVSVIDHPSLKPAPDASANEKHRLVRTSQLVGGVTGLMDKEQFLKLKFDLWMAAGGGKSSRPLASGGELSRIAEPTCKDKLVREDSSTWTWENLGEIEDGDVAELALLQQFAGRSYVRAVKQPVNLLRLTAECANMLPLESYLHAQDKHDLTHSAGACVLFDLNVEAFACGSSKNTLAQLKTLKEILCPAGNQLSREYVMFIGTPS